MADIFVTVEGSQPINVDVSNSQPIQVTLADNPINVEVSTAQPVDVQLRDEQPIDVKIADLVQVITGGSNDKNYEQSFVDQTLLNITHNLQKKPSITVLDTAGDEIQGGYEFVDSNNVKVSFSTTFSGIITLN